MPYIGKNPVGGGFHKLDALTASATDTYALTLGSAAYYPESANQLLVSLNGVIQAPQDSFTVSGSNLVFDTALTASDSIDFVVALGDVLAVQTVTDGAITTAKLGNGAVTSAKLASTIAPTNLETTSSTFKMTDLTSNNFYRTGTWTPILSDQSATDTNATIHTGTPAVQLGWYQRIGNVVNIQWHYQTPASSFSYTNGSNGTGQLSWAGLPFTIANLTGYYPVANCGYFAGLIGYDGGGNGYPFQGIGVYNTKQVHCNYPYSNAVSDLISNLHSNTNSQSIWSMTYLTDDA